MSKKALPGWPHLKNAIIALLEELPYTDSGLGRTEQIILGQLAVGPKTAGQLFKHFLKEYPILGYGDVQFFRLVDGLAPNYLYKEGDLCHMQPAVKEMYATGLPPKQLEKSERWVGSVKITGPEYKPQWDKDNQKIVY